LEADKVIEIERIILYQRKQDPEEDQEGKEEDQEIPGH